MLAQRLLAMMAVVGQEHAMRWLSAWTQYCGSHGEANCQICKRRVQHIYHWNGVRAFMHPCAALETGGKRKRKYWGVQHEVNPLLIIKIRQVHLQPSIDRTVSGGPAHRRRKQQQQLALQQAA